MQNEKNGQGVVDCGKYGADPKETGTEELVGYRGGMQEKQSKQDGLGEHLNMSGGVSSERREIYETGEEVLKARGVKSEVFCCQKDLLSSFLKKKRGRKKRGGIIIM